MELVQWWIQREQVWALGRAREERRLSLSKKKLELFPNAAGAAADEDPTAGSKPSPGSKDTNGIASVELSAVEVVDLLVNVPCSVCDTAVKFDAEPVCVCFGCGDAYHAACYHDEHGVADFTDDIVCGACLLEQR